MISRTERIVSRIAQVAATYILPQTLYFTSDSSYIFQRPGITPGSRIGSFMIELFTLLLLTGLYSVAGAVLLTMIIPGDLFFHLGLQVISIQEGVGLLFNLVLSLWIFSAIMLCIRWTQLPFINPIFNNENTQ